MLCVVDAIFSFKDQVVRHKRSKILTNPSQQRASVHNAKVFSDSLIKKVRRVEKNVAKVTCDVSWSPIWSSGLNEDQELQR